MNFYKELTSFKDFSKVILDEDFVSVPSEYWVVISDVKGSTEAIKNGKYRQVNMIGASCIAAAMNAIGDSHFPFVFGGDGATILAHENQLSQVKDQLLALQRISKRDFLLELRVGAVPVKELYKINCQLKVGKYELSPGNYLAQFKGNALQKAEKLIKENDDYQFHYEKESSLGLLNLESISCRLNPLKSTHGNILSLLIQPQPQTSEIEFNTILSQLFLQILTNSDGESSSPVKSEKLFWKWTAETRPDEIKLHGLQNASFWMRLKRRIFDLLVSFSIKTLTPLGKFDPQKYKAELILNSDYKKFDEVLRMVIDCSLEQTESLKKFLEKSLSEKKIFYGLHISKEALMTCMVESATENHHIHFIDGAGGGYALAALQLKQQIRFS